MSMTDELFRGLDRSTRRSPLRYPGGKSQAARELARLVPGEGTVLSPFVGGGSVELELARLGRKVMAFDIDPALVDWWQFALTDAAKVAARARELAEPGKLAAADFDRLRSDLHSTAGLDRAARYFVLNRASFSGTALAGGFSEGQRYTAAALERLAAFECPNLTVSFGDFRRTLSAFPAYPVYADPPYRLDRPKLYGKNGRNHSDFDHEGLATLLTARDNWLLCYNDCRWAREKYDAFLLGTPKWAYGMNATKRSSEVLFGSRA